MPWVELIKRADMKFEKNEVLYENPSTRRIRCMGCRHFEIMGKHTCDKVAGSIQPEDWCNQYSPKWWL